MTGFNLKLHVTTASTAVTMAYTTEDGILQTLSNQINTIVDTNYVPCTLKMNGRVITFSFNNVVVLRGHIATNVPTSLSQLSGTIPYSSITQQPILVNGVNASLTPNTNLVLGTSSPQQLCHVSNVNLQVDNAGVATVIINSTNPTSNSAY